LALQNLRAEALKLWYTLEAPQHLTKLYDNHPYVTARYNFKSGRKGEILEWAIAYFICNPKTSIQKSIKRASKPSKPTILAKQAKQASLRCQKLQASKLSLLSLARLLIPNSVRVYIDLEL
jgi:hypothetical protein